MGKFKRMLAKLGMIDPLNVLVHSSQEVEKLPKFRYENKRKKHPDFIVKEVRGKGFILDKNFPSKGEAITYANDNFSKLKDWRESYEIIEFDDGTYGLRTIIWKHKRVNVLEPTHPQR